MQQYEFKRYILNFAHYGQEIHLLSINGVISNEILKDFSTSVFEQVDIHRANHKLQLFCHSVIQKKCLNESYS